ncbi:MAG: YqgE/AlgH family protein [Alphaproteobacteria bacterium]|nr:YqgE/AlgH family protein [Alphaproteobacteria bacterium]
MPLPHTPARRSGAAAVALLATAILLAAAAPDSTGPGSLRGQLLIAAPTIGDPRFAHAVILMVRDDKEGAFGIVINRPIGKRPIAKLLEAAGDDDPGVDGSVTVFAGGPVQPELGFVVHSAEYRRDETLDVDGRVAMTASRQILRDIGHHQGPEKSLFAFGYAGWGPGQLEAEVARHDWFLTPEQPKLIFDDDRGRLWEDAMARRTREL